MDIKNGDYEKPWKTASFPYKSSLNTALPTNTNRVTVLYYTADIPIGLAKSLEGKYFVGMAEDLEFVNATNAWARLYNPPDSGVNLFVNVWTSSDITSTPYRVQIYFDSNPPGIIQ